MFAAGGVDRAYSESRIGFQPVPRCTRCVGQAGSLSYLGNSTILQHADKIVTHCRGFVYLNLVGVWAWCRSYGGNKKKFCKMGLQFVAKLLNSAIGCSKP